MHAQPTTTTEHTTWLQFEVGHSTNGVTISIRENMTANQLAHEYRAYHQERPDYITTGNTYTRADGLRCVTAMRADTLHGARVIHSHNDIRLCIPGRKRSHCITGTMRLTPNQTAATVAAVRAWIARTKEAARA